MYKKKIFFCILIAIVIFIINFVILLNTKERVFKNTAITKQFNSNNWTEDKNKEFIIYANELNKDRTDSESISFNTKYLQNLLNNVSESGGGIIHIPEGTFYFATSGMSQTGSQDFVILCKNNVTIEGEGLKTILKPYGRTMYGLDMFYFNEYADSKMNNAEYLDNADFRDFVIDGSDANTNKYTTAGKGFMINLYKNCDWNNVVVKYTDGTGFGMDCPINSTITNCIAIGCGKAATSTNQGASGFGIGTGYNENESMVIENCIATDNKKYGFFFEHQGKFNSTAYTARTSKGFVIRNCQASGNMYDFGGEKSNDLILENCTSESSDNVISHIHFEKTSRRAYVTNCHVNQQYTDITDSSEYYYEPIYWALDNGITDGVETDRFGLNSDATREQVITMLWRMSGRPGEVILKGEDYGNVFDDLSSDDECIDAVKWAKEENIIDSSSNYFYPKEKCTRADFITFLWKYAGSPIVQYENTFTDIEAGAKYEKAVNWAVSKGIAGGIGNEFKPDNFCEREDVVTFLFRYQNSDNINANIVYDLVEGSLSKTNPNKYVTGSSSFTINNPVRDGYTFLGWTGSNGSTPSKNVRITNSDRGNKVYTANWKRNNYKVLFNSNGGTGIMSDEKFTYDELKALPDNKFTKSGATFIGWNTKQNGTGKSYSNKDIILNLAQNEGDAITLYAQWKELPQEYDTTFKVEHYKEELNGDYKKVETETYESYTGIQISPEVKSYEGFSSPEKQTVIVEEDGQTVVKYYYTRNEYTISIKEGKGIENVEGAGTYKFGQEVNLRATVGNGYENISWYILGGNKIENKFLMPSQNIEVNVFAQLIKYNITYNLAGGVSSENPNEYTIENEITLQAPIKTGYTFLGWTGSNGNIPEKEVVINKGSIGAKYYTANWQENADTELETMISYKKIDNNNVLVTIQSNIPIKAVDGWNLSEDKMSISRAYTENVTEKLTIISNSGKNTQVLININNIIDKVLPKIEVNYEYLKDKKQVIVTLISSEKIENIDGWATQDNIVFTKIYDGNTEDKIIVKDLAGNSGIVPIKIDQIYDSNNSDNSQENIIIEDNNKNTQNLENNDNINNQNDNDSEKEPSKLIDVQIEEDNTIANNAIPQTGKSTFAIIISIILVTIFSIIILLKLRRYKGV